VPAADVGRAQAALQALGGRGAVSSPAGQLARPRSYTQSLTVHTHTRTHRHTRTPDPAQFTVQSSQITVEPDCVRPGMAIHE
jgi:hypothetical protein